MTPEEKRRKATEATRRWRAKQPKRPLTERERAAGRERGARWRARHPEKTKGRYDPTARLRRPWTRSYGVRQAHAKKKGIPFTIRTPDLKAAWTGKCAVTGLPFDLRAGTGAAGARPFSPSLDRIKPARGYVPGNIRFVLNCVNMFKGTMNDRLMARVAAKIAACYTVSNR